MAGTLAGTVTCAMSSALTMTAAVTAAAMPTAATRLYRSTRHRAGQDHDQQYRQLCPLRHLGFHVPGGRASHTQYDRQAIFLGQSPISPSTSQYESIFS